MVDLTPSSDESSDDSPDDSPPDDAPPDDGAPPGAAQQPQQPQPQLRQSTLQFCETPEPAVVPEGGWLLVDLFCSIGGVSCAAKQLGHTVVLAIDMDEGRLGVHALNHPRCRHVAMELGHAVTDEVVSLIETAVPAGQRHRLWLHLSPPCQTQSAARLLRKRSACPHEEAEQTAKGLVLVQWALELVQRLQPAQWSLEEVNDSHGRVAACLQAFKRQDRTLFDFEHLNFLDFGVPQSRSRIIGARPATMHALRLARSLRVPKPVCISDVLSVPKGAVFLRGIKNRHVNKIKMHRCPIVAGRWSDGRVELWEPWLPAQTVCASHPHSWMDAAFDKLRVLSPAETGALMTFPSEFVWPAGRCDSACNADLGNAVPVLFARKLLLAASLRR